MARKGKRIKPDQLGPKLAAGLTEGPFTIEDARREFPRKRPPAMSYDHMRVGHARGEAYAAFVLEPNGVAIQEPNTGRMFQDVDVIVTEEQRGQIIAGYRCLKCKEPFEQPWPLACEVCGYEVHKRQVVDAAMELEGTRHVGPSKPLKEYVEELEERASRNQG